MELSAKALKSVIGADSPQVLTTDNDRESIGSKLRQAMNKHGVLFWLIKPYQPHQKGKMQRFWCHLHKGAFYNP
jgi:hypothetical protein